MKSVGITHIGNVRKVNEDSFLVCSEKHHKYLMIADGMGGHAAGEVASKLACDSIRAYIHTLQKRRLSEQDMLDAVEHANKKILAYAEQHPDKKGMGTTLTFAVLYQDVAKVAQVGDSRAYLFDGKALHKITTDHTYVQYLIDKGIIQESPQEDYPFKNIITRALGIENVTVDLFEIPWKANNVILLCSDGLTNYVKADALMQVLRSELPLEQMAQSLMDDALAGGGKDNISIVLAQKEAGDGADD